MKSPYEPEVVKLGNGISESDLLVHDEKGSQAYAFMLAHMGPPEFPVPIGVIRSVDEPSFETAIKNQISEITDKKGAGDLHALLHSGDVWEVK